MIHYVGARVRRLEGELACLTECDPNDLVEPRHDCVVPEEPIGGGELRDDSSFVRRY